MDITFPSINYLRNKAFDAQRKAYDDVFEFLRSKTIGIVTGAAEEGRFHVKYSKTVKEPKIDVLLQRFPVRCFMAANELTEELRTRGYSGRVAFEIDDDTRLLTVELEWGDGLEDENNDENET